MQAPVALFVYNRIDHTKLVLQALDKNEDADKSELYIFSDAPADETEVPNVAEVREYLRCFEANNHFRKVSIIMAEKNKGLEKSLIGGITQIIDQYGKIIVLEDDHLTSPDFIRFMNEALAFYEKDDKIWSVTGFTMDLKRLRRYKRDVYCGYRGCCWGWGTWKDRWDKVDWNVSDYHEFIKDRKRVREFNKGGIDMTPMLKLQHEGKIHSWAIRWCYQQYKEKMLTIFPRNSKVKNIGMDGSGTNCGSDATHQATLKPEKNWNFAYQAEDDWVYQECQNYYAKLFIRQKLGALWYALTEYEYCLAYRCKESERYSVLKPNFREWYTNAIPFRWNNGQYLFMAVYHKLSGHSVVGVSRIEADGTLTKPHKTNMRMSKDSIPSIFVYKKQTYMMLTPEHGGDIRFYIMDKDIVQWKPYCKIKCDFNMINAIAYKKAEDRLYVLVSEAGEKRGFQSKLRLFQLEKLEHKKEVTLKELWQQNEYSYTALNAGPIYEKDGIMYRSVRNDSENAYGRFVTLNEITQMNEQGFAEKVVRKIGLTNINVQLPPFLYRKYGVYGCGENGFCETVTLRVQRFSVGGLFMKARRLLGIHDQQDDRGKQK